MALSQFYIDLFLWSFKRSRLQQKSKGFLQSTYYRYFKHGQYSISVFPLKKLIFLDEFSFSIPYINYFIETLLQSCTPHIYFTTL